MAAYSNSAEGGTNGAAVTPANSGGASGQAWASVLTNNGGAVTYSTTGAYRGALGYRFGTPDQSQAHVSTLDFSAGYQRLRFYSRFTGYPSAPIQLVQLVDGTGDIPGFLALNQYGTLYFVDYNDNTPAQTTNGLPLNTWLRIEVIADPDTTNSGGRVSFGYALGDGSMVESFTRTGQALGYAGTLSHWNLGKVTLNGVMPTAYFDEVAWDNAGTNSTFIGSSSAGRFKVGATTPSLRLGSTAVGAVYSGATQLYP